MPPSPAHDWDYSYNVFVNCIIVVLFFILICSIGSIIIASATVLNVSNVGLKASPATMHRLARRGRNFDPSSAPLIGLPRQHTHSIIIIVHYCVFLPVPPPRFLVP